MNPPVVSIVDSETAAWAELSEATIAARQNTGVEDAKKL